MSIATEIRLTTASTPEVCHLIGELDDILSAEYPPEQRFGLSLAAIFQPHIRFFVAWRGGIAAGCGGVALFDDLAEVKRMYVRPSCRGHGIADALMHRLAAETGAAGFSVLRLETGIRQGAALRFYARHGFRPCAAFGAYAAMTPAALATSVFLEKTVAR